MNLPLNRRNFLRQTTLAGALNDRRWLKVVEDVYGWHYRNERYLRNLRPLARVAMVYSQQTSDFYGAQQGEIRAAAPSSSSDWSG